MKSPPPHRDRANDLGPRNGDTSGCGSFDYSVIDTIIDAIVTDVKPSKIIVFGSVADGTARVDSDIDLLIVMETELRPAERAFPIERALYTRHIRVDRDIIVVTPEEFRKKADDEGSFISEACRTGYIAYEF